MGRTDSLTINASRLTPHDSRFTPYDQATPHEPHALTHHSPLTTHYFIFTKKLLCSQSRETFPDFSSLSNRISSPSCSSLRIRRKTSPLMCCSNVISST